MCLRIHLGGLVSDNENSRLPGIVGYFSPHVAPAAVCLAVRSYPRAGPITMGPHRPLALLVLAGEPGTGSSLRSFSTFRITAKMKSLFLATLAATALHNIVAVPLEAPEAAVSAAAPSLAIAGQPIALADESSLEKRQRGNGVQGRTDAQCPATLG